MAYNTFIEAYANYDDINPANDIYEYLKEISEIKPDENTLINLIKFATKKKDITNAMKYFKHLKKIIEKPNRIIYNSMLDLLVKEK